MTVKYSKLIPALVIGGYLVNASINAADWHFIDGANLIFHEAGHWIFAPFPEWLTIAGGSMFQVLLPLFIAVTAFLRRQFYTSAIVLMWVGQSLFNVSVYAGDALTMKLDLIGGEATTHDWNHLLWYFGALRHTAAIATTFKIFGTLFLAAGLALSIRFSFDDEN